MALLQPEQVLHVSQQGAYNCFASANLEASQVVYARSQHGHVAASDGQQVIVYLPSSQAGYSLLGQATPRTDRPPVSLLAWNTQVANPEPSSTAAEPLLAVVCGQHLHIYQLKHQGQCSSTAVSNSPASRPPQAGQQPHVVFVGCHLTKGIIRALSWHPTQQDTLAVLSQADVNLLRVDLTTTVNNPADHTPTPSPTPINDSATGIITLMGVADAPGGRPCSSTVICATWMLPQPPQQTSTSSTTNCSWLVVTWGPQLELLQWDQPHPTSHISSSQPAQQPQHESSTLPASSPNTPPITLASWICTHRQLLPWPPHSALRSTIPRAMTTLLNGYFLISCDMGLQLHTTPALTTAANQKITGVIGTASTAVSSAEDTISEGKLVAAAGGSGMQAPATTIEALNTLDFSAGGSHNNLNSVVPDLHHNGNRPAPLISEIPQRTVSSVQGSRQGTSDMSLGLDALLEVRVGREHGQRPMIEITGGLDDNDSSIKTTPHHESGTAHQGGMPAVSAPDVLLPSQLLQGGLLASFMVSEMSVSGASTTAATTAAQAVVVVKEQQNPVPAGMVLDTYNRAAGTLTLVQLRQVVAGRTGTSQQQGQSQQAQLDWPQWSLMVLDSSPILIPRASHLSWVSHNALGRRSDDVLQGVVVALASSSTPAMVQLLELLPPSQTNQHPTQTAVGVITAADSSEANSGTTGTVASDARQQPRLRMCALLNLGHPGHCSNGGPRLLAATPGPSPLRLRGVALSWQYTAHSGPPASTQHAATHLPVPPFGNPMLRPTDTNPQQLCLHVLQGIQRRDKTSGAGGDPPSAGVPAFTLLRRTGPVRLPLDELQLATYIVPHTCLTAPAMATTTKTISNTSIASTRVASFGSGGAGQAARQVHLSGPVTPTAAALSVSHAEQASELLGVGIGGNGGYWQLRDVQRLLRAERAAMDAQFAALQQHIHDMHIAMRHRIDDLEEALCRRGV